MRVAALAAVAAVALTACQGSGTSARGARTGSGSALPADALAPVGAGPPTDAPPPADDRPLEAPPDPGAKIAALGAISAWQAVIDRAQYLARRGQVGWVHGRVGGTVRVPGPPQPASTPGVPPPKVPLQVDTPYTWLVDDTEGHGSLGIRVLLAGKAKEGDRVALQGAWTLDEARRWYWKVEAVEALPPAAPSTLTEPPAHTPGLVVAPGPLPAGARTISVARDNDVVYFQVVGPPPINDGDGWLVADELGDPPVARLTLPGERGSYGGHDMRAPDERWSLRRGVTYTVRIGRIRKRTDEPSLIGARTAPIRVQ